MSQPINMPQAHGDARLKCGQCRWFLAGYEGKNCQLVRLVASDTRACIEFQQNKQTPFQVIERDKFLIEMRKTMLVWTDQTIKKFNQEIKTYKLQSKKTPLSDAMAYVAEDKMAELGVMFDECQALQERLLDMRLDVRDKTSELRSFADEVQSYLFANYQDVVQGLKNEGERKAFYRVAAPELYAAVDKMENLKDKVEITHEVIKNMHWNLRGKLDAVSEIWKAQVASVTNRNRTSG